MYFQPISCSTCANEEASAADDDDDDNSPVHRCYYNEFKTTTRCILCIARTVTCSFTPIHKQGQQGMLKNITKKWYKEFWQS